MIALTGNPNSGKTTLYNLLTKSGEATGNRSGVTFAPKRAKFRSDALSAEIIDLPGTYSLYPLGNEESAAVDYLRQANPDIIIDIADATNLERGLFLATELTDNFPRVVLALNMIDEARHEGINIDTEGLSLRLGIPVVAISAASGEGVDTLIRTAASCPERKPPERVFKSPEKRYSYCSRIYSECVTEKPKSASFTDKVDRYICKSAIGIPLFLLIVFLMFAATFSGPVKYLSEIFVTVFERLSDYTRLWLEAAGFGPALCGLFSDGILRGAGAVLSFLPQTAVLFLILEILEDTGYMARSAYVTDSVLRSAGLSGKAFIPFLLGFGCTVPAVMSTATLDYGERKSVIYSLPFIPCSARFPVFAMLIGTFFGKHQTIFAFGIYVLGVIFAYVSALLFTKSHKKLIAPPLAIELPKFRMPRAKNLTRAMNNKIGAFIIRAGSIVMLCSAAMYFLCSFDIHFRYTSQPSSSLMSAAGELLAPLLRPCGLGDWRICSSLLTGIFAKETLVSSMQILCGGDIAVIMSAPSAASMCVFTLLYCPCAATIAVIKKEAGIKTAFFVIIRCLAFAYAASFITYTLFNIFI